MVTVIIILLATVLLVESIQELVSEWKTSKERKIKNMTLNFMRLVTKNETDELAQIIVDYAAKHKFTAKNIMDSVDVALAHMKNNAVLTKED